MAGILLIILKIFLIVCLIVCGLLIIFLMFELNRLVQIYYIGKMHNVDAEKGEKEND